MTESKPKVSTPPILIGHLSRAEEEARKAFNEIESNTYENKSLGKQKQAEEAYPCDCHYRSGQELTSYVACGEHADCINRLTQTECTDECRSKSHCQNQRLQRRQYASLEIVQTELKGFGLRAGANIKRNDMIYEYIGEVVSEKTLLRRMRAYNDEGIKHFYFMMLQKGEFIDATKRGGIGRFANHSCNPNCYVAKWVVGNRLRMAIFAKRAIVRDEELTFNYNVDRYGNDAQVCHCGEANCVGFIGGKTQTEVATMDDVYLDALGLDEDEIRRLSINIPRKGKKGKKDATPVDIEEAVLNLPVKALEVDQVSALLIAMRKSMGTTRPMLVKLLSRLQATEDLPTLRQFLRLRGLGLLAEVIAESSDDSEVLLMALQCAGALPMSNRIKIEDIGFEDKIRPLTTYADEALQAATSELLEKWSHLEQGFRIPRRKIEDDDVPTIVHTILTDEDDERPRKKARVDTSQRLELAPALATPVSEEAEILHVPITPVAPPPPAWTEPTQDQLQAIIARAAATAAAMAAASAGPSSSSSKEKSKHRSSEKSKHKERDREALKEKQLKKLIGGVVVKTTSKHAKQLGTEAFKKFAEECTSLIAEKEKKSSTYATAKLDKLSEDKQAKIKKFAKDFFAKAVHKMEKKKASRSSSSPSKTSASTTDPRRLSLTTGGSSSSLTMQSGDTSPTSPTFSIENLDGDEDVDVVGFVDQMFGGDEGDDEEETLKAEETPDGDMDIDGDQLKGTVENTPTADPSDREASEVHSRGVKMEVSLPVFKDLAQ